MSQDTGRFYLKWLTADRKGPTQGVRYPRLKTWTAPDTPVLCRSGWHACRWEDAIHHIDARLWVCELDGQIVEGEDKVAATRLRLVDPVPGINDRTLRLFAADCAEDVLHLFEAVCPGDDRPRQAIAAARQFANGEISAAARAAAGAAAGPAAWAAARAAAGAAARAAVGAAAGDAAWAAAGAAARAAARDAARAAARAAAREAQTSRLLTHYAQLDPTQFVHRDTPAWLRTY